MSVAYRAVQWNSAKVRYDLIVFAAVLGWMGTYVGLSGWHADAASPIIVTIQALGSLAFALLVVILSIGPMARLCPAFAPLLYNRRHLGVTMALVAVAHGALSTVWYHGFGVIDPVTSLLTSGFPVATWSAIPFQVFGFLALVIIVVMAATSHDFWLRNLSPATWKSLHLLVYVAFLLLVVHVGFGVLQDRVGLAWPVALSAATAWLVIIHLVAGFRVRRMDRRSARLAANGWAAVGSSAGIPADSATAVRLEDGTSIAIFRTGDGFRAIGGVCAHQGGPLAEGRIIDGCATCPWHGYQYRAEDGCSPPPYTERLPTYEVRIEGEELWVRASSRAHDGAAISSVSKHHDGARRGEAAP